MTTTTIDGTTVEQVTVLALDVPAFRDLVLAASVAASKDYTLPTLEGIRVEWDGTGVRMVSTDRYRLVRAEWCPKDGQAGVAEGAALVPAAELVAYVKALPKPSRFGLAPTVLIHPEDGQVRFTCVTSEGEVSRTIRTLAGDFPKYQSLIPTEFAGLDGDGIGVNPKYLADVAKMPLPKKDSPVRVRFTASGRPMVWEPTAPLDSGVQWLYLLMPVRIGQ